MFEIVPNEITMEIKFGKNITRKKKQTHLEELQKRNLIGDRAIIEEIIIRYPEELTISALN